MKLTLPKNNLTTPKKGQKDIEQLCVIENNEKNRKAIKHINKLAKQQQSKYKIYSKFRCAIDNEKKTLFNSIKSENAKGIGLYIRLTEDAQFNQKLKEREHYSNYAKLYNEKLSKERKYHSEVLDKLAMQYDKVEKLEKENRKLKKKLLLKTMSTKEKAIYIMKDVLGEWMDGGIDEKYFFDDDKTEHDWDTVLIEMNHILHEEIKPG